MEQWNRSYRLISLCLKFESVNRVYFVVHVTWNNLSQLINLFFKKLRSLWSVTINSNDNKTTSNVRNDNLNWTSFAKNDNVTIKRHHSRFQYNKTLPLYTSSFFIKPSRVLP